MPLSQPVAIADYELFIEFEKGIGNPQRIYKAMSRVLEVLSDLDATLVKLLDSRFKTDIVLVDVQTGSLRSIIRVFLESIPEEGLKEGNIPKIIGTYLNNARLAALKALQGKPAFDSQQELVDLKNKIDTLCRQTGLDPMNAYGTLHRGMIADYLDDITKSVSSLGPNDIMEYRSAEGNARFNPRFNATNLSNLASEGEQTTRQTVRLRIKKADLLGESRWEFRMYERKTIEAKIQDHAWLRRFHNGEIQIKSGDLLEVELETSYLHGPNYQTTQVHYTIVQVVNIISPPTQSNS